jgi:hypothetical protein
MPAAAAIAPESPHLNTSTPTSLLHCGHQAIQDLQLCCPMGTLNFLLSARSLLPHMQMNFRLHALLFCWHQEASLPTEYRGPVLTTKPSHGRAPTALSNSKNPAPPLSGNLPFCGCQETCLPKAQKDPALPTVPNHRRALTSPLKTKNATFPIVGRKAVTYYSVSGTRKPAF